MTQELFDSVSRAFKTDYTKNFAVGFASDGKVFVAARLYEEYYPTMPEGKRNGGSSWGVVYEIKDRGTYCILEPIVECRFTNTALAEFNKRARAEKWRTARNQKELDEILADIVIEDVVIEKECAIA